MSTPLRGAWLLPAPQCAPSRPAQLYAAPPLLPPPPVASQHRVIPPLPVGPGHCFAAGPAPLGRGVDRDLDSPAAPSLQAADLAPLRSDRVALAALSPEERREVLRVFGQRPEALTDVSALALSAVRATRVAPPCRRRLRVRVRGASFRSAEELRALLLRSAPTTPDRRPVAARGAASATGVGRTPLRVRKAATASRCLSAALADADRDGAGPEPPATRRCPWTEAHAASARAGRAEKRARAAEQRASEAEAQVSLFRDLARKRRRSVGRLLEREDELEEALAHAHQRADRAEMGGEDRVGRLHRRLERASHWRDTASLDDVLACAAARVAGLVDRAAPTLPPADRLRRLAAVAHSTAAALDAQAVSGAFLHPPFPTGYFALSRTHTPCPQHRAARHSTQQAEEEAEALRTAQACIVCHDAPRQVLLLPCGHLCACTACATHPRVSESCPVCRGPVEGTHTAYFS